MNITSTKNFNTKYIVNMKNIILNDIEAGAKLIENSLTGFTNIFKNRSLTYESEQLDANKILQDLELNGR